MEKITKLQMGCKASVYFTKALEDPDTEKTSPARERTLSLTARSILKHFTGCTVGTYLSGQPFLLGAENRFISISHCDPYVICAVGDSPIGIDIEKIRKPETAVLRHYFTEQEREKLEESSDQTEETKKELYTRMWTCKEALGKMTGRGLARTETILPEESPVKLYCCRIGEFYIAAAEQNTAPEK